MQNSLTAPVSSYRTQGKQHKMLLTLIALVHVAIILAIINLPPKTQFTLDRENPKQSMLVFMYAPTDLQSKNVQGAKQRNIGTDNKINTIPAMASTKNTSKHGQSVISKLSAPSLQSQTAKLNAAPQTQESDREKTRSSIDHHIPELTKQLERELAQEERKNEAAKPPNQLVREYWEKQNHPYQTKWQALAANIEKAAVPRGTQEESYTLDDGSRITKFNGVCYKAPDPGREYLGQAEVRRVFCPRH
ncbi:hypothetical protein RF679_04080 [Undibacterium cyanobacteriorum]|uniref:Uncharacterized protein n=1 Tax=Undibacterium cyanobacteriorum TaxID=3073561 RepID=A0ABY9RJS9_9BURK|nr:hypothetical protein [Undibacterium sp. 20NA77.5]WMW81464.1 hypothetical protein RF679_04080 [Undibacterium sp. 20NA77.5]